MSLDMTVRGRVAELTIGRPRHKNAFSLDMWQTLRDVSETIANDPAIRAVMVAGTADAFSVGGDFDEFVAMEDLVERTGYLRTVLAAYAAYERLPVPTIAAVRGWVLGGGCELAMLSDIVVAADSARFGLPEAQVGLYPGVAVARQFGHVSARLLDYLIYSGRTVDAETALTGGIATLVVPDDEAVSRATKLADDVAAQAPLAVRSAKRAAIAARAGDGYRTAGDDIPHLMSTADHREGLVAFAEGRGPDFEGA